MSGRIYLLRPDAGLSPMTESPYDSESMLQQLLATHPDLLAGEQIDQEEFRRWLLISREMGVPGEEDGGARWSLDHLFLDQDAVPTLVEVKRSTDTRIRREVVGQMLDYAANAIRFWPVEQIQSKFEARCEKDGLDAEEALSEHLKPEEDQADFWQRVKTNLLAGKIRMVFVAEVIPAELRRVVEFLNSQMDPAEVLALEVRQFVGDGMKTLVPRVIGQTETARQKKAPTGREQRQRLTREQYLEAFDAEHGEPAQTLIRRLIDRTANAGLEPTFTHRKKHTSFIPILRVGGVMLYPFSMWETGQIYFQMRHLKAYPPFDDELVRAELYSKLKDLPGFTVTEADMEGFPRLSMSGLTQEGDFAAFLDALGWIVEQYRQAAR